MPQKTSVFPGSTEQGRPSFFLMFDCPFSLKMPQNLMSEEDTGIQKYLDDWRLKNGDAWLESIGPILKNRELRNIGKNVKRLHAA